MEKRRFLLVRDRTLPSPSHIILAIYSKKNAIIAQVPADGIFGQKSPAI